MRGSTGFTINTPERVLTCVLYHAQILVVGPKLVFSYTLAQSLIPWFSKYV